jgi:hypothetical protein
MISGKKMIMQNNEQIYWSVIQMNTAIVKNAKAISV